MESYLVVCESLKNASTSEVSGYHIFSAFAANFRGGVVSDPFPHNLSVLRPVVLSRLYRMPKDDSDFMGFFAADTLPLRKGDRFGFRVSFLKDGLAGGFFREIYEKEFRPGQSMIFRPVQVLGPGEHTLCGKAAPDDIRSSDFSALRLRFLSPTGFNRSGLQIPVPLPELVFKSLLKKWQTFVSTGEWSSLEDSFRTVRMEKFSLQSQPVWLKKQSVYRGCLGFCEYTFHHLAEDERKAVSALGAFSYYAGVGYKTSQGMGQVFPEILG